ncbi:MAG: hypothetical protein M1832_003324 [Thelocarpon impressellum]|nr:MAG: hypothetical protein M1832_003324 [Thelocarpon impressellum]
MILTHPNLSLDGLTSYLKVLNGGRLSGTLRWSRELHRSYGEPQYETPPIPAPYRTVSGDGGFSSNHSLPRSYWESGPRPSDQSPNAQFQGARQATGFFRRGSKSPARQSISRSPSGPRQDRMSSPALFDSNGGPQNPGVHDSGRDGTIPARTYSTPSSDRGGAGQLAKRSKSVQWAEQDNDNAAAQTHTPGFERLSRLTSWELYQQSLAMKPLPPPPPPSKSPMHTHPFLPPSPETGPVAQRENGGVEQTEMGPPSLEMTPVQTPDAGEGPTVPIVPTLASIEASKAVPTDRGQASIGPPARQADSSTGAKGREERATSTVQRTGSEADSEKETVEGSVYESAEEEIVMSSTAYPGQEWLPVGYKGWED